MVARRDERIARIALGSENHGGRLKSGDDKPELVKLLTLDRIDPDPDQPRRYFDPAKLQELAHSLTSVGQIQPIIVVRAGDRYRLHVGERRWRASQLAGLATIRAIVRTTPLEARVARIAQITENEQRADLLPSELIDAIRDLQAFDMKNVEIAAALAKPPSRISELQALTAAPSALLAIVDTIGLGLSYQLLRQWRAHPDAALDFIAHMPVEHISRVTIATIGEPPSVAADVQPDTAPVIPPRSGRSALVKNDAEGGSGSSTLGPSSATSKSQGQPAGSSTPIAHSLVGSLLVEHAEHGRGRIVFGLDVPVDHFAILFSDATPIVTHKDEITVLSALLYSLHDA